MCVCLCVCEREREGERERNFYLIFKNIFEKINFNLKKKRKRMDE